MSKRLVYFIHPPVTYNSRTEREVKEMIKYRLGKDIKIISPSRMSSKRIRRWKEDVQESFAVVGMALENKYTISVWTLLEYAEKQKKLVYTVRVDEGGHIWKEGIEKDVEKLSLEESRDFTSDITLGSTKDLFRNLFWFGGGSKY
ncbi:MAG: hypothetical protein PVF58_21895 [Candidatus Methanofastidiosia archaeon]